MKVKILAKNTIRYGGEYLSFKAGELRDVEDVELVKLLTSFNIAEIIEGEPKLPETVVIKQEIKPEIKEEIKQEPKVAPIVKDENKPIEFKPTNSESKKSILIELD